ncbi:hypothetical protein [Gemmiger formicilis]|uniref:hypothetical protein n=1 Tax=Gemmiger formicilis TaxID=745368 RepID=UPI003CCADE79
MTKVRLGNLYLAAAVAGVILCAVLMRAFYMPYSGFLRTVLYNILIFSWAVSVWWRILHAQTRHCLLGAAALMLFWLDIRLIRYDFAQTPEMLRRLWYAYYIPMLLIPTLALYTLFFLDRGQSAPLYKYRYMIFVFPVVLFSLVLTNDCHQLAFAFPPGQEVLGSPDYTLPLSAVDIFLCRVHGGVPCTALPYSAYKAHPLAAACADFFGHPLCFTVQAYFKCAVDACDRR